MKHLCDIFYILMIVVFMYIFHNHHKYIIWNYVTLNFYYKNKIFHGILLWSNVNLWYLVWKYSLRVSWKTNAEILNSYYQQQYSTVLWNILTGKVRIERVWTPAPKAIEWSFCGRFWIFTYRDSSFCTLLFIFVFSCCWENWCSRWEKSNTLMKHDQSSWSCLTKVLTLCVMAVLK